MKKLMAILICLSLVLLMSGTVSAVPRELLINGGFEEYSLIPEDPVPGWRWNPDQMGITGDTWYEREKSCIIYWDGGTSQEVEVIPGESYVAQGAALIPSGGDPVNWGTYIAVDWLKADGTKISGENWSLDPKDYPRDIWHLYNSGDLTAPVEAAMARIGFGTWAQMQE